MNPILFIWYFVNIKISRFAAYFSQKIKYFVLYMFYPLWYLIWQILDIRKVIQIKHSSGVKYLIAAHEENNDVTIKLAYFLQFYDHTLPELRKFAKNKVSIDFCDGDDEKFRVIFDIKNEKSVMNDASINFDELNLAENVISAK